MPVPRHVSRELLLAEIEDLPEDAIAKLIELIAALKAGWRTAQAPSSRLLEFVGSWSEMTEEELGDVLSMYRNRSSWSMRSVDV